jgi:hypothetical protein
VIAIAEHFYVSAPSNLLLVERTGIWKGVSVLPGTSRRSASSRLSVRARSAAVLEALEARCLLSVVRPDHVVVVIEQDRASDAIGNPVMPYFNSLAATGLVYSNSHGVTHPSEPNSAAIYSGSTQGVTDNWRGYSFTGPNIAKSFFDAGLSFGGYVENLPSDGSQVQEAGDSQVPDLYTRNVNPMAQFTTLGTLPSGQARPNSAVNRTFNAFKSISTSDYSSLPTLSYIIPNNFHSTHGSNETYPWAGSGDEENNQLLRGWADTWLHDNLDPYLTWAKSHNSLLIVTQDEEWWTGGTAQTVTTIVNGDPDLFVPGTNTTSINHYNVLRTIEDMYGLTRLNNTATAAPLVTNAQGLLAPVAGTTTQPTATSLVSSLNPAVAGQSVMFTATVTGSGIPTGSVSFKDGSTVIGTGVLDSAGKATFTTSALSVASHSITAVYGGSAAFAASTSSTLTQTITAPASVGTTTTLTSNLNPAIAGQTVTLTATVAPVSGSGVPSGQVTFKDGSTVIGSASLNASGKAVLATSTLTVGSHAITASYGGGAGYLASTSSTLTQTVNSAPVQGATSTTVSSNLNPSVSGQLVTFTAVVKSLGGSGVPGGSVTFKDGSKVMGSALLDATGAATFAINTLTIASHSITAVYSGDATFTASTSAALSQTVNFPAGAPVNDSFSNRITINGTQVTMYGTSIKATKQTGEPKHAGNQGGKSVWWTWTAPSAGTVTIDTLTSNFDTLLAVYTGTSVSALTSVASNDDIKGDAAGNSRVSFNTVAGRVYQIAVDGWNNTSGAIALHLSFAASGTKSLAAINPFSVFPVVDQVLGDDLIV